MMHANDLTHNLIAYRFHGLYRSASVAGRAFVAQHMLHAFAGAFPRHLHQTQLGETVDAGLHPVFAEGLLQGVQHPPAMVFIVHVDEINDDNAAEVTQTQLAGYRLVASILVLKIVSSRLRCPTNAPVLISMVVIASVWSMIRYPRT